MTRTAFAILMLAVLSTGALAHSKKDGTTPANDATVDTVEAIEMRFDTPMRVTAVTLSGPDGDVAIDRETGLDPVLEFRALPAATLPAGDYSVDWRGLAADGHPMQGTFVFTVAD